MQTTQVFRTLSPPRIRQLACRGTLRCGQRRGVAAMAATNSGPVVSVYWLKENLHRPDVRVLDATWFMPTMGRSAKEEFKVKRIPGSLFFDIDGVANTFIELPHMVPSQAAFSAAASALDVGPQDTVVLYDRVGNWSSPRAWWTWKIFGHDRVVVLKGGFPAWVAAEGEVTAEPVDDAAVAVASDAAAAAVAASYPAQLDKGLVKNMADVAEALQGGVQLVDARSSGRFKGNAPEPRPDIPSGAMPGAFNVPFTEVLVGEAIDGELKSAEDIKAAFSKAGVDIDKPLICTCGSGATAAVLALGIYAVSGKVAAVYDGSWMEWASVPGNPIVTDKAE